MELLGHRAAAYHLPAFQHQRLESALGQIKCRDQSVVPAADNDHFLSERHRQCPACARELLWDTGCGAEPFFHSFKITVLAILPGAAIIPPPGWVADPHMYNPGIGVL